MELTLAWLAACAGLALGGVASFVPGFPGSAVALFGVLCFAALTEFSVVTPEALVLAAGITAVGALGQVLGPVVASRAAGGAAGVATGATIGAALGALVPLPAASWLGAVAGASLIGTALSREGFLRWLCGLVGVGGGCLVTVAADLLAVLALAALLAVADLAAAWP